MDFQQQRRDTSTVKQSINHPRNISSLQQRPPLQQQCRCCCRLKELPIDRVRWIAGLYCILNLNLIWSTSYYRYRLSSTSNCTYLLLQQQQYQYEAANRLAPAAAILNHTRHGLPAAILNTDCLNASSISNTQPRIARPPDVFPPSTSNTQRESLNTSSSNIQAENFSS